MYSSMIFDKCIELCNYCHNQDTLQFFHFKRLPFSVPLQSHPLQFLNPGNTDLFSITMVLPFLECCMNGSIQCI